MRFILIAALFLTFTSASFAQQEDGAAPEPETVAVEQIFLARDNGEGKAGDVAESFLTTDVPIYCVVQLNSTKPATVRMNFVAVSVQGVKAESKVISVSYKTNGRQNRVNFTGKPETTWTAGSYRIDIFIDDKLAGKQVFEIKKSPSETGPAAVPADSFVAPKPKPRPKPARPARRG